MPTAQTSSTEQTLILHHLSDLHYGNLAANDAIVSYRAYLDDLPKEQHPNLLMITGDLTESGAREDFIKIEQSLKTAFPHWKGHLKDHIFIVPGQNDISWDKDNPSFTQFYEVFKEFALPSHAGNANKPYFVDDAQHFLVYLLDTCSGFENLCKQFPKEIKQKLAYLPKEYEQKRKEYNQSLTKKAAKDKTQNPNLRRKDFLELIEDELISLDTGMLLESDIDSLENTIKQLTEQQGQLRIVVTHHPLINPKASAFDAIPEAISFRNAVVRLRNQGFQMALHGHLHSSQVITDMSLINGQGNAMPLQQYGAGSIGDDYHFNAITAKRVNEKAQWQFHLDTIGLKTDHRSSIFSLRVMDPAEIKKAVETEKRDAALLRTREQFEQEIGATLRLFNEATMRGDAESPNGPLQRIRNIIEKIIFPDYRVQVGLAIKEIKEVKNDMQPSEMLKSYNLVNRYLDPRGRGYLQEFRYPTTAAAWALILGRELIYPQDFSSQEPTAPEPANPQVGDQQPSVGTQEVPAKTPTEEALDRLTTADNDWLNQSGKISQITEILSKQKALVAHNLNNLEAHQSGVTFQVNVLGMLRDRLDALLSAHLKSELRIGATYQEPSDPAAKMPFISVPIPLRPEDSSQIGLPEVAVLNIDVLERLDKTDKSLEEMPPENRLLALATEAFTKERIAMLRIISTIIYTILTEAAARKKIAATWEEPRANPYR